MKFNFNKFEVPSPQPDLILPDNRQFKPDWWLFYKPVNPNLWVLDLPGT